MVLAKTAKGYPYVILPGRRLSTDVFVTPEELSQSDFSSLGKKFRHIILDWDTIPTNCGRQASLLLSWTRVPDLDASRLAFKVGDLSSTISEDHCMSYTGKSTDTLNYKLTHRAGFEALVETSLPVVLGSSAPWKSRWFPSALIKKGFLIIILKLLRIYANILTLHPNKRIKLAFFELRVRDIQHWRAYREILDGMGLDNVVVRAVRMKTSESPELNPEPILALCGICSELSDKHVRCENCKVSLIMLLWNNSDTALSQEGFLAESR